MRRFKFLFISSPYFQTLVDAYRHLERERERCPIRPPAPYQAKFDSRCTPSHLVMVWAQSSNSQCPNLFSLHMVLYTFQMNDGPLCRCSIKARRSGIRHGYYAGEESLTSCDPLSNNANKLYHYLVTISPPTNFLVSYFWLLGLA